MAILVVEDNMGTFKIIGEQLIGYWLSFLSMLLEKALLLIFFVHLTDSLQLISVKFRVYMILVIVF